MNTKELLRTLKPIKSEMIGIRSDGYVRNIYLVEGIPIAEDISLSQSDEEYYNVAILIPMSEKDGNVIAKKYHGIAIACDIRYESYYVCFDDVIAFERALDFVRDCIERKQFGDIQSITEFRYEEEPPYYESINVLIQSILRAGGRKNATTSALIDVLYAAETIAWRLV